MIARDGAMISLWQDNISTYAPVNKHNPDTLYDVIIVGGGITGMSTALLLQQAGKQCIVLEKDNLCFGTTGGTTAHLNTLLDTTYADIASGFGEDAPALVANAARAAIQLIRNNIYAYDIECGFMERTAYVFAESEDEVKELDKIYTASVEKAALKMQYTDTIPIPVPFTKAISIEEHASFNPTEYVYGIAKAYEAAGGVILQDCHVTDVQDNDTITATTSKGSLYSKALVYATHIPTGVNLLHLRCTPWRSYALALELDNDDAYPDGLVYDSKDPYHYYRTQTVKGKKYLIAGGNDHKTAHEENTEHCFIRLEAYFRNYFNIQHVAYKWSSQYYESADGLPYIGNLPGHNNNIFVATGFGGNGMTYSGVAALLLSDMIIGKENEWMKLFNPNRIKPIAGFTNFIKQNADVVVELVHSIIPADTLHSLAELAKGEARVVDYEDKKIALYKDEEGELHAIGSTCTHLKCTVSWNNAEKSWDCPCHGARFSCDGKVLTAPADRPLPKIDIS